MAHRNALALGYVYRTFVNQPFAKSLVDFAVADRDGRRACVKMIDQESVFLAIGRTAIVDTFLDYTDADWLLFVDTDVRFTPADVYRLLDYGDDAHQIVAGLCFTWVGTPQGDMLGPNWFIVDEPTGEPTTIRTIDQGTLNPMAYCGMAFTLVGRRVCEAVRKENRHHLGMSTFGHEPMWTGLGVTLGGEDTTFCVRAARCGFQTWGAGDVIVDHFKLHAENLSSFMQRSGRVE